MKTNSGNQRGGARPGAGRKKGSATKRTREIADRAAANGVTPLEYMLSILQDEGQPQEARYQAAKDAAPYMHPRLATVEASVEADVTAKVSRIELVGVRPSGDS